MAFASFDLQNERVTSIADYAGSETNNLEPLKDSNRKITRVATAHDDSVHIFEVGGTFCKMLYTDRKQAKSLQQLADGSLVVGTVGKIYQYPYEDVFGSCDDYPVADVTLSSNQVIDAVDSFMTMADGTVVQGGTYPRKDPDDYTEPIRYFVEIFYGEDIRSAMNTQTSRISPSVVVAPPSPVNTLLVFGNYILYYMYQYGPVSSVCILNTDQLKEDVSGEEEVGLEACDGLINLPLTPDERSPLGTPSFISLSDTSFVVLSPGESYYDPSRNRIDAPFQVQRYDLDGDLKWRLSSSIDGHVKGLSNSIVTIQGECVAFTLDSDSSHRSFESGELYFANVGTNDTTTLTFHSNVTKIDTIDDQLVVATVGGLVYMLDKANTCGYDAAQLAGAKAFSIDDGSFELVEKLQDGSYAIAASYDGSKRVLVYENGPQQPSQPDYSINTLLRYHSVMGIDEFAAPGPNYNLNLVIYGEKGTGGVFYPEGHPALSTRYGSPVRRIEEQF